MLKKIVIGFLCFIILAVTAAGIYVYTLDWNKHKTVVENRFSQITGLKAVIDGNLKVEIFPSPKFSANKVKFSKAGAGSTPLIVVDDISAHVDLMALLHSKFILSAMTLTGANVNVTIDDKDNLNWSGVGKNGQNKSGNLEVSFNDIRLTNSRFNYKNIKENEEFSISNISASISAPSLKGPYKTDGKFIHNNSEVKFKGNLIKDEHISLNWTFENSATTAKATIEGSLGSKAQGNVIFDAPHLTDTAAVIFGEGTIPEHYEGALYFSFKYDHENELTKLENINIAFGKQSKGTGTIALTINKDKTDINANIEMSHLDLGILENMGKDLVSYAKSGKKFSETDLVKYSGALNLKSDKAFYKNAEAKEFISAVSLQNNQISISRLGVIFPGNSVVKTAGNVDLSNGFTYQFNQDFSTDDLRTFASLFNVDLSKYATGDNKKVIFKKAGVDKILLSGNLDQLKIALPSAFFDTTKFSGDLGFVFGEEKTAVLADIKAEKFLFDKYMQVLPQDLKQASFKDKLVYQLNLIPWSHDLDVDARFSLDSGVYNQLPIENLVLEFKNYQDSLDITKLSVNDLSGANINLSLSANNVYKDPYFKELSYDIKSDKFSKFTAAVGLDMGTMPLFKRDIFASQGALSGTFSDFSLSSVQRFGDTEFAYTGVTKNTDKELSTTGDLELKSDNFSKFIKDLGLDYKPDLPVTTFTLSGKVGGAFDNFTIDNINAHLGANAIKGNLSFDNRTATPVLSATLDFDKFDADRLFNLNGKNLFYVSGTEPHTFIAKPSIYDEKIDYSSLKDLAFKVLVTTKQLVYRNKNYSDAKIDVALNGGKLNVDDFQAKTGDSLISLQFVLDSNNVPAIEGSYAVKGISIPVLGGSLYALEGGVLDADGTFKTSAVSQKAFFENLTSYGKFQLVGTTVKGWDLDIIKFELEQRDSVAGFEDSVLNSLKNGRSAFSKIQGKYDISKGLLVTENALWNSPVVSINMKLDLNFDSWLFNAVFNTVYNNASFSDVMKFTFDGNLANPAVKVDLKESIDRISETENMIQKAKDKKEKAQRAKLSGKIIELQAEIDRILQTINQLSIDIARFKPVTKNANVIKIYDTSVTTVSDAEKALNKMRKALDNNPDEKMIMSLEADLATEKSKLTFIPKTLEDNFVVDSKYVYDDTFNKIAWVYNVAQNNSSYYASLTEAYMEQIYMMDGTDNSIPKEKQDELADDMQAVMLEMDKITALHNKVRESYLSIIDAAKVSEMKKNNEIANQALNTILSYTEYMDKMIVDSIDKFSVALDIQSRDYDDYMVYPPKNADDIDVSKPTVHVEEKPAPEEAAQKTDSSEQTKPKIEQTDTLKQSQIDNLSMNIQEPKNGLFSLISKIKTAKEEDVLASNLQFSGLSDAIKKSTQQAGTALETVAEVTDTQEKEKSEVMVAEAVKSTQPDVFDDKETEKAPIVVAETVDLTEQPTLVADDSVKKDENENKTNETKEDGLVAQTVIVADASDVKNPVEEEIAKDLVINSDSVLMQDEKKELSNHDSIFLADLEEIKDGGPVQSAVNESIHENVNQGLVASTQTAMDEILQNIKKTEEGYQTLLAEHQKDIAKEQLADNTVEIKIPDNITPPLSEDDQSYTDEGPSKLKVNPVVALGIGKHTLTEQEQKLAARLDEKTGFKKNDDVSSSSETKSNVKADDNSKKVDDKIVTAQASKGKKAQKLLPVDTQSLRQDVLKSMLAYETNDSAYLPRVHKMVDDAPVFVDDEHVSDNQKNRYVFASSSYYHKPASGLVQKSMYANVKTAHKNKVAPKYLFAVNDTFYSPELRGQVDKNLTLYVK